MQDILMKELIKLSEPMGVDIVELSAKRGKYGLNILVVIYKDGGVTIRDCEKLSQLYNDRLAILKPIEEENYTLQVSSPGLYREFKNKKEYSLFQTRKVKVIVKKPYAEQYRSGIVEGILERIKDNTVILDIDGEKIAIPFTEISKTKLNG